VTGFVMAMAGALALARFGEPATEAGELPPSGRRGAPELT